LLLAGIRAYADLHENPSDDGKPPATSGSGDASLDSFAAAFVAEAEDAPGTLRNLRY
jgi:hypothetical protein